MTTLERLFSLEGKNAIVTGGAQGIGKVVATRMAEVGANIAIFDLQLEKAQQVAEEIAAATGKKTAAYICDVTDPDQVKAQIEKAAEDFGGMDLLFNNAGIAVHKSAYEVSAAEWNRVINVNLNGEYYMASEFARYLKANGRKGRIVNTASMSAHVVNQPQCQASYNASKAGVVQMTKSLAVEYWKDGIYINCVSPGYMRTELCETMNPVWQAAWMNIDPPGRYGVPEELCGGIIYLFSEAATFTTGTDLIIDGGFSLT